jgi:hypothetical protein
MPHTCRRRVYPSRARSLCLRARGRRFPGHRRGNPRQPVTADAPIGVRRMPTHYASSATSCAATVPTRCTADLRRPQCPARRLRSATAASRALKSVTVGGQEIPYEAQQARIFRFPADVVLQY